MSQEVSWQPICRNRIAEVTDATCRVVEDRPHKSQLISEINYLMNSNLAAIKLVHRDID